MHRPSSNPPQLPGYQFVRILGSGGFSDVFLYDQQFPKRRVAVKVLLTEELTDDARNAFAAEANVMAQLSAHPYIVTIFQAAVADDDRPYFVMEYCSGPSLGERYKRERFSVADALQTGIRLSSAIATAHSAGILHRDIKPANVLTNDFGWPALTDFGISSAVDDQILQTTTTSRVAANAASTAGGTASVGMSIPWSPPEMFEDFPDPDVRSDVFSLAATIYTLLAGHTPFEVPGRSNGSVDLVGRIARGASTPMPRDDVPRSLIAVLNKGMASERADRFATAIDFGRALQRVELELSYASTPLDVPNLGVARPMRSESAEEDPADETRARSISTIRAQSSPAVPVSPTLPVIALPSSTRLSTPVAEQTVVRRIDPLPAETMIRPRGGTASSSVEHPARASKRSRVVTFSLLGAAVIVAGAIVAGIAVFGAPKPTSGSTQPSSAPTGQSAVDTSVTPDPTNLKASLGADGSTVTFAWTNPDPRAGDTYAWVRTDDANATTQATGNPTAVILGVPAGSKVCVRAMVVRDGVESPNPITGCYP